MRISIIKIIKGALIFSVIFTLAGPVAEAAIVKRPVPYQSEGFQLEGYLAFDDAIKGKRPGVLVVHEWWGLNDSVRKRVDELAGEALAYDRAYLAIRYCGSVDAAMLGRLDFLQVWLESEGLEVSYARQSVEAEGADGEAARLLSIPKGTAVILAVDTVYGEGGEVFGVFESVYRGDRIKLVSVTDGK